MKNIPYYFIAFGFIIMSAMMGGMVVASADYIHDKAYERGLIDALIAMPMDTLDEVKIHDI